mmetsp:Transcript_8350/g.18191  ORF Transcript_8350/g.18191 Transcript_8350/m.18191 type:complete len:313 (-) Transcript_8350:1741-2679(-)
MNTTAVELPTAFDSSAKCASDLCTAFFSSACVRLSRPLDDGDDVAHDAQEAVPLEDGEGVAHLTDADLRLSHLLELPRQLVDEHRLARAVTEPLAQLGGVLLRHVSRRSRPARRDDLHVDLARVGIHGCRLDRVAHQTLCLAHVSLFDKLREAHARVGLRQADQALQLSRSRRNHLAVAAHVAQLHVAVHQPRRRLVGDLRMDLSARVGNVLHEGALVDGRDWRLAIELVEGDEVQGELRVGFLVGLVEHQIDEVESREERGGQVDVLDDGALGVVLRVDGVGGGEDRGARVEGADDARLGHRDRLLLHRLV